MISLKYKVDALVFDLETVARSMAKTLTYRVVVFALLAAITYYYTGNVGQTTVISVAFNVSGAAVYYFFERLWNGIGWGKDQVARGSRPQKHQGGMTGLARHQNGMPDPNDVEIQAQ